MWLIVGSSNTNLSPARFGGSLSPQRWRGFREGSRPDLSNGAVLANPSIRRSTNSTALPGCIGSRRAAGLSIQRFASSETSSSLRSRHSTNLSSLAGHRRPLSGEQPREARSTSPSSLSSSLRPHSTHSIWSGYQRISPPFGASLTLCRAYGLSTRALSSRSRSTRSSSHSKLPISSLRGAFRLPSRVISPPHPSRPGPTLYLQSPTLALAGRVLSIPAAGLSMSRETSVSPSPSSTVSGSRSFRSKRLPNLYPTQLLQRLASILRRSALHWLRGCLRLPSLPFRRLSSRSSLRPTTRTTIFSY